MSGPTRSGDLWAFVPKRQIAPIWWLAVVIALVAIDYQTGPYFQFPAVYVLPVTLAAWTSGAATGVALAVVLPLSRLTLMLELWGEPWDAATIIATAIARAGVFSLMAVMTARLAEHERARAREVQVLRSLLSVCGGCQKIRDGESWTTLDDYVTGHGHEFAAGLCPACARLKFPEHFPPASGSAAGSTQSERPIDK